MSLHKSISLASLLLASLMLAPVLAAGPAAAGYEVNHTAGMTLAGAPLAIHGYDPVAFFTDGAARLGKAEHTVVRDGAAYRFGSATNQRRFEREPERYLPQYGGFCAYGVSVGAKFDGDPRVFEIVEGKLYFNLNPDIQATWKEDVAGNVRKADQTWPRIRSAAPANLK